MQGARRPQAGFTLHAAQRGSLPGAAQAGGAQRPPAGAVRPLQVSSRHRRWRIIIIIKKINYHKQQGHRSTYKMFCVFNDKQRFR